MSLYFQCCTNLSTYLISISCIYVCTKIIACFMIMCAIFFLLFYFALINYFRSEFVDLYENVSGECWFDVDIECINI